MVTANGNYLTKHSAGLYSTEPTRGPWRRQDPKKLQSELDAAPRQRVNTAPAGTGTIETYCVTYGKERRRRPTSSAGSTPRATASSPWATTMPALLADMLTNEQLGRKVTVSEKDGRNVFRPL